MSAREAAKSWGRDVTVLRQLLKKGLIPGAERNGPCRVALGAYRPTTPRPSCFRAGTSLRRKNGARSRLAHAGANRTKLARAYGVKRLHVYRMMEKYPPENADDVLV